MELQHESYRNHKHPNLRDLLELKVHIHHFDNLSHIQCETFNPLTIVFKKLFSQEGQDYLRTHFSKLFFLTSNMLDDLISNIIHEVQELYNIDMVDEESNNLIETPLYHNSQPKVFNLSLEMEIHKDDIGDELEMEIEEEYYDESIQEVGMVPASKEAIKTMKTTCDLNVTKLRDILCCTICMDEFDHIHDTSKVCTMPCNHVFHEQCIVKWLQTSNTCPLCRYSMPTALDS
ncbi:uncharacterized protein LOC131624944 [Vicia villosa]|uniref:uncharacterized protein LOC131624944 n=1 Tax=Vicia villosa TaxID=3911 RepID=UPI00273C7926|nr:uncharacterized protein LOC131624944 [Vicia villosa]